MTEATVFHALLFGWFPLSAVVFAWLLFVPAPYGRHVRPGWGPSIGARTAWLVMELPAVLTFPICLALSRRPTGIVPLVFLALWELHYVDRALLYPFRARMAGKTMPLSIALTGAITNIAINYLNARWAFDLGPVRDATWLLDPRFVVGVLMYTAGYALNRHSDRVLLALRAPGETGYRIPRGGAFDWVSCPNYLGEIVQWSGWALLTFSLPGLAFALWTASNLVPRALEHHRWYARTFPDYPRERRALLPGLL